MRQLFQNCTNDSHGAERTITTAPLFPFQCAREGCDGTFTGNGQVLARVSIHAPVKGATTFTNDIQNSPG